MYNWNCKLRSHESEGGFHRALRRRGCDHGLMEHKAASAMARGETDGTYLLRSLQLRYYYSPAISSGRNTSSKRSAVRKPRATQASFREMFSAKAFFTVFAAFSYPM